MKRITLAAFILVMASLACSLFGPNETPIPAITETDIPNATATTTLTAAPSAITQPTETATALPTPSETPIPSPTPDGYFQSDNLGFSMIQEGSWYLDSEESNYAVFANDNLSSVAWIDVGMRAGDLSIQEYAEMTAEWISSGLEASSHELGDPETITVTNQNIDAEKYPLTFGGDLDYLGCRIVIVDVEGRYYSFLFLSPIFIIDASEDDVISFMDTFTFYQPRPFGLAPEDSFYQLGRDPDENDIDPAVMTASAADYPGLLFAGLVALKPDLSIVPDLAAKWDISEGGTVYTFTLRENLQFADGTPLTAEDVKASWERATDPEIDSPTAMTYLGDILGVPEKLNGEADEIVGVEVINALTLKVTLDGPKPYFLAKLTYPTSFVVDVDQINSDPDWWLAPNASGPYQVLKYEENDVIIFERNPVFYAGAEVPYIVYNFSPGGTQISLFETSDLDVAYIGGEDVLRLQDENEPLREFLYSTTTMCTTMLKFDNTTAPFDDLNVRKAFTLAVDQAAVNDQFSEGLDRVAVGVLPPAMPGFTAENVIESFNAAAAQEALAASDYANDMPEIILSAQGYGDTDNPYIAMLVDMWQRNLGVTVTVEYIDPDNFSAVVREEHGQIVLYGWCADYPDPENFLQVLFHTESDFNVSG